jgi:hypothetical protein
MGNLTGLLARVKPAITATVYADEKSSKSEAYVDAVARTNVLHAIGVIRQRSKILTLLKTPSSIRAEVLDQIRTVGTLDPIRSWPSCSRFSLTATRAGSLKSWVLKESSIVAEREGWSTCWLSFIRHSSGGLSFGSMVKSADLWDTDDSSGRLHRPRNRSVLVERKVSSRPVRVLEVGTKNSAEWCLVKDDQVVETVAANRADDSFDVGPLPGWSRRSEYFPNAQSFNLLLKHMSVNGITIPKEIFGNGFEREGFQQLLRCPSRRGMSRDVEVEDATTVIRQNDNGE